MQRELQGGVHSHPTQQEEGPHHTHCVVECSNAGGKAAPVAAYGIKDKIFGGEPSVFKFSHKLPSPIRVCKPGPKSSPRSLAPILLHSPTHTNEGIDSEVNLP